MYFEKSLPFNREASLGNVALHKKFAKLTADYDFLDDPKFRLELVLAGLLINEYVDKDLLSTRSFSNLRHFLNHKGRINFMECSIVAALIKDHYQAIEINGALYVKFRFK